MEIKNFALIWINDAEILIASERERAWLSIIILDNQTYKITLQWNLQLKTSEIN